jgi:hypothetical protein
MKIVIGRGIKQYIVNKGIKKKIKKTPYPAFELVKIIAGACLKHSDSGESSFNKEARVILMELEEKGYKIKKDE